MITMLTTDHRSIKAIRNIIASFAIKGVSVLINLALIPLTINYLNPTNYGVWLTISSILSWINFFDIGLGHGLRNKLAESIAQNNWEKARSFVSTAYVAIAVVCAILLGLFLITNQFLNWKHILNIQGSFNEDLRTITSILFVMFSLQFTLQLIYSIFLGIQEPARVSFFNMLSNVFVLAAIMLLIRYEKESLLHLTMIFSVIPVLVIFCVNFIYFRKSFKKFSPTLTYFKFDVLKDVLSLGVKFFVIQITVLVFYETTNLLICRFLSPAMVAPYNIAFRYFGLITMAFSIITAPYWSAYTDAYTTGDFQWIKKSMRQLIMVWGALVVVALIMLFSSKTIYNLWIGEKGKVDFAISFCMMLYTLVVTFGSIFIMFLNGIGKIKLQLIVNLIGMLLFIPLAWFFCVYIKMGTVGIILATIICSSYGVFVAPIEVYKILSKAKVV